jgi:hypothetical protein
MSRPTLVPLSLLFLGTMMMQGCLPYPVMTADQAHRQQASGAGPGL